MTLEEALNDEVTVSREEARRELRSHGVEDENPEQMEALTECASTRYPGRYSTRKLLIWLGY